MSDKRLRWESGMMGGKPRNPESKPDTVYFDGAECEHYEKAV
jgi:hypothetical protein